MGYLTLHTFAKNALHTFILLALLVVLGGCSKDQVKRGTYDALHQRECIERTGQPNCDPNYPSYEEYKRQRAAVPE